MESISKLYEDVMAGVEKTAADTSADGGPEFDASFFEKVAEGDEESTAALNDFIDESRAAGHSDEEIEEAVDEAMQATGADDDPDAVGEPDDEYEAAKLSAYDGGAEQALADVLESDMAKEAGVSADDLVDYELGMNFGAGYADARGALDEAIQKIAAKGKKGKGLYQRLVSKMTPDPKIPGSMRVPRGLGKGEAEMALSEMSAKAQRTGQRRAKGAVAGAAGAGGLGAAYLAGRRKKKDKK